jgi:para-aminobenzoate synthetase component 1
MLQKRTYEQHNSSSEVNTGALNNRYERICILDSNVPFNTLKTLQYGRIIAIGVREELIVNEEKGCLKELQKFCDARKDWLFGYISYDVKNDIEALYSTNYDRLRFPALHFFVPQLVVLQDEKSSTVFFDEKLTTEKEVEAALLLCFSVKNKKVQDTGKPLIKPRISREEYLASVGTLKAHIRKGDIYEVNFCQEFFAENAAIDPAAVYEKLSSISSAPFSAYGKFGSHYLACASPERFLRKTGNKIISQPIKGTSRRSADSREDEQLKKSLQQDEKERSENIMIVDLVRNDLSRIAAKGSVKVDELCGIYSFRQVHQMISTISCELREEISFTGILKALFPMGSMTGAPKISAMKLIEEQESTKRGLYSGAVGYISPGGDFDFNVVIRSILYNAENGYLSFMAGSAITDKSVPETEYEECLLKAKAMFEVLSAPLASLPGRQAGARGDVHNNEF